MTNQRFFELLPSFIGDFNVGGITIKHTGKFITNELSKKYDVEVPVFGMENPNDLPYTQNSLRGHLSEEFQKFRHFIGHSGLGLSIMNFIEFDDSVKDIYIPKKIMEEIGNCLVSKDFNKVYKFDDEKFRIIGKFKRISEIGIDGDNIYWQVYFKTHRIEIVDYNSEFTKKVDESDYDNYFDTLRSTYGFFEDEIWDCLRFKLSDQTTFVDFDWMSWYTNINHVYY